MITQGGDRLIAIEDRLNKVDNSAAGLVHIIQSKRSPEKYNFGYKINYYMYWTYVFNKADQMKLERWQKNPQENRRGGETEESWERRTNEEAM